MQVPYQTRVLQKPSTLASFCSLDGVLRSAEVLNFDAVQSLCVFFVAGAFNVLPKFKLFYVSFMYKAA